MSGRASVPPSRPVRTPEIEWGLPEQPAVVRRAELLDGPFQQLDQNRWDRYGTGGLTGAVLQLLFLALTVWRCAGLMGCRASSSRPQNLGWAPARNLRDPSDTRWAEYRMPLPVRAHDTAYMCRVIGHVPGLSHAARKRRQHG